MRTRSTISQLLNNTSCIKSFCAYAGLENDRFHNAWMRKTYSLLWRGCSLLSALETSCWRRKRLWRSPSTSLCSRCVRTTDLLVRRFKAVYAIKPPQFEHFTLVINCHILLIDNLMLRTSPMHSTPPQSEQLLLEPSTSIRSSTLLMSLASFSHFPERVFRHTVGCLPIASQLSQSPHRTTES